MSKVFISYRREDSAPYAGRICDRLGAAVGTDQVFMDVQDIAPGADFTEAIDKTVGACDVLVAVIGPRWLEILKARGSEHDFVEQELAAALRRGITVIPVLVGGAAMPRDRDLPPGLMRLARRQAIAIRDESFDQDASDLVRSVRGAASSGRSTKRLVMLVVAAGVLIALAGSAFFLWRSREAVSLDGLWIARMQRPQQRPYNVRLRFQVSGRTLTGQVEYPTGSGAIQSGTFEHGRLAFSTRHVPQFETEAATIIFSGEVRGRVIHLSATTPDGQATEGIARRRE